MVQKIFIGFLIGVKEFPKEEKEENEDKEENEFCCMRRRRRRDSAFFLKKIRQKKGAVPFFQLLYSAKRSVLKYRSPVLGAMATISLPLFSGRRATFNAAHNAAPDEIPHKMPSSRINILAC